MEKPIKIQIQDLGKQYKVKKKVVTAFQNVSLTIKEGEFVSIVGPSGCGKTTLQRIMAGLEYPTTGVMDQIQQNTAQPLNSMVFQEHAIFPWMTVRQNIAYGLNMRKVSKAETNEIVQHYLNKTGLSKFADSYPHQLSGGMKQRVSVARAFARIG